MLAIAGEVSLVRSIGRISRNGADRKGKLPSDVTLPGAELPGRAGLRPAWWPVRIHKYKQLEISGCLYLRIVTGRPARRAGPGSSEWCLSLRFFAALRESGSVARREFGGG